MRAKVDPDTCAGHGDCVSTCPEVFAWTDAGYAEAMVTDIPAEYLDAVRQAAHECPEHAITLQ